MQEMRPTPVSNELALALSKALRYGRELGDKVSLPEGVPLVGGMGLGELILGDAATAAERAAYGERLTKGRGQTLQLRPETLDLAGLTPVGPIGVPLKGAKAGAKAIGEGAKAAATSAGYTMPTEGPLAEKIAEALRKHEVQAPRQTKISHKRFKTGENAGIYRGSEAFGGITPAKLGSMRVKYLNAMEEGAPGRDWYDRASATNYKLTGGDVARAEKLADIEAVTSAGTPVGSNLMYSAKGINQDLVGDTVHTGRFPNDMRETILSTWAAENGGAFGLKRSPYRAGLAVHWNGPESVARATHDIHDVRAWDILDPKTGKKWSKGVPDAGHRFLDEQAVWARDTANRRKLAGHDDWKLHSAQAAAWIAQKARAKGMTIEEAMKDYTDFIPEYSAQVTREWTPGATTGHLPEMLDAPFDVRKAYADQLEELLRGPQGIDRMASDMGALSDTTLPNLGYYEGKTNPGYATQVLVGKETGSQAIDPSSRKVMDSIANAHGLIGLQDQNAWNYLGGPATMGKANAVQIATGKPMGDAGLENVARIAGESQVDPRGARVLVHQPNAKYTKELVDRLREQYPHATVEPVERSGALYPLKPGSDWEKPDKFSTRPMIEKIEAGGERMVGGFDKTMQEIGPALLQRTEDFAKANGMTSAPWYRPMMEALSTGGLAELKKLVEAGVVPVAAFGAIASLMEDGQPTTDEVGA